MFLEYFFLQQINGEDDEIDTAWLNRLCTQAFWRRVSSALTIELSEVVLRCPRCYLAQIECLGWFWTVANVSICDFPDMHPGHCLFINVKWSGCLDHHFEAQNNPFVRSGRPFGKHWTHFCPQNGRHSRILWFGDSLLVYNGFLTKLHPRERTRYYRECRVIWG